MHHTPGWPLALSCVEQCCKEGGEEKEPMFIRHFTEQPWQDEKTNLMGARNTTLDISNRLYDPVVGAELYNRYLDEKLYAEAMGFDGLMHNEHHSIPFCMQGVTNVEAAILARQTTQAKIILLGNILPIWDDPLWLGNSRE
jgi:hypothetical protein